jgi:myo-inositol-1(or 4)-monophosphatase
MPPTLVDIENMTRQSGRILRRGYAGVRQVYHKGKIDLVTDTDRRSEAFLMGEIQRLFPDDSIIAEESGGISGQDCCTWYIDPLDGTVNYAHGVPVFCVSIAYAKDGELRLGAVYEPLGDELFSAERGRGAWLNGRPIKCSQVSNLDDSLLATGFPYNIRTTPANNLDHYSRFALRTQGVRRLGSAALDLCYVGAGRFDGYWELYLEPWDLAAGALIAQEAGALVTTVDGGDLRLEPPCSALAASPGIHNAMLKLLRE